jgi:serine/threonine protein kinase
MDRPFGNYTLHERVGIGGMGEVFRATKHGPDGFTVQVAIKLILPHLAREKSFRDRFSREACLAASLKHPNIVQVHDFKIIDETPFIEMEFVEGTDLRKVLHCLPSGELLSLDESLGILYAVARGLDHAHRHTVSGKADGGIIHCDLNPHNILISRLGETKVADFGIARAMHGDATASATVRGKLAYMSPEQIEGGELDLRSDLFSLGIIAYQLLAGVHPFERGSEGATIAAIGKAEYLPLSGKSPGLPPILCELVEKLLNLDPASRPASAAAFLEVLQPLVSPGAGTALSDRVRSFESDLDHKSGLDQGACPTAETIPRTRISSRWKYLALGAVGATLTTFAFLLSTGLAPDQPDAPDITITGSAPAAEPPPVGPSTVERTYTIETVPPGARISGDGITPGITPFAITIGSDVPPPHLEASLFGYQKESFQIPPGTEDLFILDLEPLPTGTVRISARPWARVSFRGRDRGETPVFIERVPIGEHIFTLSYDPLEIEKQVVIEVKEGTNTVSVEMGEVP